jgi:hypothetical protein
MKTPSSESNHNTHITPRKADVFISVEEGVLKIKK